MRPDMVTTTLELPGWRVTRNIGVVRGIVVRSRSFFGNFGAMLQTLAGGNITIYTLFTPGAENPWVKLYENCL